MKAILDDKHEVIIIKVSPMKMFTTVTDGEKEWEVMSERVKPIIEKNNK